MNLQEIADVLVSAWTLANGQKELPTGQGVLDRALLRTIELGNFPSGFKKLRFVKTRVGTRCPELNAVLAWAQASGQTSDPNPSYEVTLPKTSQSAAKIILQELKIKPSEAKTWGNALRVAIQEELDKEADVLSLNG